MKQSKSALCVLLAGTLWGSMGLFVRKLNTVGLYALDIVQLRIAISLVLVGLYLLIFARDKLRVRLRDLWCFAATGIVSLLLFSWCYFSGMQEASLSVMAVLLYTSSGVYHAAECASVPRNAHAAKASGAGSDVYRLLSGLRARKRQRGVDEGASSGAWLWLFLRALFNFQPLRHRARLRLVDHHVLHLPVLPARQRPACALGSDCALLSSDASVPVYALLMGLLAGFLAYIFYTKGLEGMESSRAGILASVEPVVGTIIGTLVFHEPLPVQSVLGIALVLGGIVVLSGKKSLQSVNFF